MKKGINGFYCRYVKRVLDFVIAAVGLIVLSPLLLILTIVGAIAMKGNPFFVQKRPGRIDPKTGRERIVPVLKFRTMTNEKDAYGNLLPDEQRLNAYGVFLRRTSCDELIQLINVLLGQISLIGPRPQLVRDMVFMTPEQRQRHMVRPGITGLAQVNGRNAINWESKLSYDLEYIQNISFINDFRILVLTVLKVFRSEGITQEDMATAEDYGDYLLRIEKIDPAYYREKQDEALGLLTKIG